MLRVISASRRTDILAWYARWLAAYEASAEYRASLLLAEDYPELYGLEGSGSGSASA